MKAGDFMPRGKSINLYLMDGNVNGRIKATLANWTGLVMKIPRIDLGKCKDRDELKQTGVYLLFGKDDQTDENMVYVGQAGIRKNGEGILNRLSEHDKDPNRDFWNEAIAITTSNDSLGPTEISYLEHRFCKLAVEAKRYTVMNANDPTPGNPSEEKQSELEDFIDYAKVIVGTLGHKVFVPLLPSVVDSDDEESLEGPEFYCARKNIKAAGIRTAEGFVIKKGSSIVSELVPSCPEYIIKQRENNREKIDSDFVLTEDILLNSPSAAAAFVCGSSANGNVEWKTSDGLTLKAYEEQIEE